MQPATCSSPTPPPPASSPSPPAPTAHLSPSRPSHRSTRLALDSIGNLYAASPSNQVLALERTQALTAFASTSAPPITVNLLSTGNAAASLTLNDPDQTNFALTPTPTTDCAIASSIAVAIGGACQFNSQFTPASYLNFTNTATFSGNAANAALANPAALQIVQTGNNAPIPGTVQLITTATLSKLAGGGYQAVVTITNNGTGTAQNVKLTAATLGSATGSPLPISLGNIAPGRWISHHGSNLLLLSRSRWSRRSRTLHRHLHRRQLRRKHPRNPTLTAITLSDNGEASRKGPLHAFNAFARRQPQSCPSFSC